MGTPRPWRGLSTGAPGHLGVAQKSISALCDGTFSVRQKPGSCSPSTTGSSEERRGVGAPSRAPQVKAPKMPLQHTAPYLPQGQSHCGPCLACNTLWHPMLFPPRFTHMSGAGLIARVWFPQSVRKTLAVEVCLSQSSFLSPSEYRKISRRY